MTHCEYGWNGRVRGREISNLVITLLNELFTIENKLYYCDIRENWAREANYGDGIKLWGDDDHFLQHEKVKTICWVHALNTI